MSQAINKAGVVTVRCAQMRAALEQTTVGKLIEYRKMARNGFKVTFAIYCEAIQPVIDWCEKHPGSKTELRKRLDKATGRRWRKENITRWLHADKKKRVEPAYGIGVILLRIGHDMMQEE